MSSFVEILTILWKLEFICKYSLQSYTLLVEYLPSEKRGKAVLIMALFWALGCLFMALLAWAVMDDYGWRMLIGLSSAPLLIFVSVTYWLPESPLYLATVGRQLEMETQIRKVFLNELRRILKLKFLPKTQYLCWSVCKLYFHII